MKKCLNFNRIGTAEEVKDQFTKLIMITKANPAWHDPKASEGPRMLLILPQGLAIDWLKIKCAFK